MTGFNFEKNLEHQSRAVKSTIGVFDEVEIQKEEGINSQLINPSFNTNTDFKYVHNIGLIQEQNSIERSVKGKSNVIDIIMETGTGKTYTYTKTIFELNKLYGIFKFVIVVPTLPIKAGTINFLNSDSAREHFKEQYGKTIKLHIVESKNGRKNKKSYMPQAVTSFVEAGNYERNKIQVLIINAGMINSKTMDQKFDKTLLDNYNTPFNAISSIKPFLLIDEPHKFAKENKSWQNIQKMSPQFIIRYGATFKENENLIYNLTAVDSFNKNLVKGIMSHVIEFGTEKEAIGGKNAFVKFTNTDGREASFELTEKRGSKVIKKTTKLLKNDSLEIVHNAMTDLYITGINKSRVLLSNGLELKKGDKINPYSFANTLQEIMIKKAITEHFKKEKEYLTRDVKIKPLTLFFIDNIDEYRNKDGYTRKIVEESIEAEVKELLKIEKDSFYKEYLEKTLKDISKTHGGYFSKDNSDKDEAIEKEVNEILHDKQAILNLENPRRFIFSKWTLREGWDNPNIFQICKLRSSGSEISKLQEVGRGLRLPVNQYGNRVKDEPFYLNYFVDFTENDFIEKLKNEINEKSGASLIEDNPKKLNDELIKQIVEIYRIDEDSLLDVLDKNNVVKRNNDFKENGLEYIKKHYALAFPSKVNKNKIIRSTDGINKVNVRVDKYSELKELWEKLNEKVILEYKIENEKKFKEIFKNFLNKNKSLEKEGFYETTSKIGITNKTAVVKENGVVYGNSFKSIATMKYSTFLKELSKEIYINMKTLHNAFTEIDFDINKYRNYSTIRLIKEEFSRYLMYQSIHEFEIAYKKVNSSIHPTKLTNEKGEVLSEISASTIGVESRNEEVADNYLFDKLFFDSHLEEENIKMELKDVIVFTKIPKNSIKIPIAGGKTYSPDFAYVLKFKDGSQKINFIIETKDTNVESLRNEEQQKIKHAEKLFNNQSNTTINIKFETQFENQKIRNLLQKIHGEY